MYQKLSTGSLCRLLVLVLLPGCGSSARPLLKKVSPLNGSTGQEAATIPTLQAADAATIDAADRRVVLYDVSGGGRRTVAGDVETLGPTLTYHPKDPLPLDRELELVVERAALAGEELDELDDSESPAEPITWPFRLGFSTGARPKVRAAYLDRAVSAGRVTVRFSQPMDAAATTPELKILDQAGKSVPFASPAWPDPATAQLDLNQTLDPAEPYRLEVGSKAIGQNGLKLDSNGNGTGGEADDLFSGPFSGSQAIILSRQPRPR